MRVRGLDRGQELGGHLVQEAPGEPLAEVGRSTSRAGSASTWASPRLGFATVQRWSGPCPRAASFFGARRGPSNVPPQGCYSGGLQTGPGSHDPCIREKQPRLPAPARRALQPEQRAVPDIEMAARRVIAKVRAGGDAAVRALTAEFDKRQLDALELPAAEWDALAAQRRARRCARRSSTPSRGCACSTSASATRRTRSPKDGVRVGSRVDPLARIGIYVPGGKARYPSTVIMTAVPARVAGVREIVMATPGPSPETLAAARLAGVDRVFVIGGAQAIAALAYGTESVPRVDKIVGPGNAYVAAAKRLVFGDVGIDSIAGPTEVVIAADDSVDPRWIAADLLAQAEHDELAVPILVARGKAVADARRRRGRAPAGRAAAARDRRRGRWPIRARSSSSTATTRSCAWSTGWRPNTRSWRCATRARWPRGSRPRARCSSGAHTPESGGRLHRRPQPRVADRRQRALRVAAGRVRLRQAHVDHRIRRRRAGRAGRRHRTADRRRGPARPRPRRHDPHQRASDGMNLAATLRGTTYRFRDLKEVLAKANEEKSGDRLAGAGRRQRVGAGRRQARAGRGDAGRAAREPGRAATRQDAVTRLIHDDLQRPIYDSVKSWTVAKLREHVLADTTDGRGAAAPVARADQRDDRGLREADVEPRPRDAARKIRVVVHANNTLGLPGRLSIRLQPNHPSDRSRASWRRCARGCRSARRRGDRHQPGDRRSRSDGGDPERDRRLHAPVAHPDAELLPGARHHADEGARAGRAAGPDVPVDRRDREGAAQLRRHAAAARRGAGT